MNRFGRRAAALASALCLTWGAGVLPASANDGDIAATIGASGAATAQAAQSEQTTSVAQPEQQPELPQSVASDVPDDATLVSPDLAVLPDGTTKNVETGATVTDPALVGTADAPADPLDRTGGQSFVPMTVADAKSLASTAATADDHGNYWGSANGTKAFYQSNGQLFVQQAAKVIDVSKHNGTIDWQAVKDSGVDGAIIRIGYGAALNNLESQWDVQARRNISECKRLGIPFGVYLYSYADGSGMASDEGEYTARLLRYLGVSPSDLAYPVYYDLEQWSWTGHVTPTDPAVYEQIARAWYSKLEGAGYGAHLGIYSYTSYLNGPLNNAFIHDRTTWVAQYSGRFTYAGLTSNWRGWQYTSSGGVGGVSGDVDVSAFGYATVYAVKGAMGDEWQRIGAGNSVIGDPVADEVCDWTPGRVNCYQNFQGGAISWTPSTGAHYTAGAIREEWRLHGFEQGVLGYPVADEVCAWGDGRDNCYQNFEHGAISWTPSTGAHYTSGSIRQTWSESGFEHGILGYPVADEVCDWTPGRVNCYQNFQDGAISWTPSTGAFYTAGELRNEWRNRGFEHGILGYPTAHEEFLGNGWWRQHFQHGDIWVNGPSTKYVTLLDLRDAFNQHRGYDWLGAPTANEENMGDGYWRQRFERGDVWTRNGASEKYAVMLELRNGYYARGGFAALGGPVSDERNLGWIWQQDFQRGVIQAH